jgi:hypothetical protein
MRCRSRDDEHNNRTDQPPGKKAIATFFHSMVGLSPQRYPQA